MTRERTASIRLQLQLARQAASRGAFAAARLALSQLSEGDFAGGAAVTASHLNVLRDRTATDDQIRDAIHALVCLRPGGAR